MICLRNTSVDNEQFSVRLDRSLSLDEFYRNVSVQDESVIRIKAEVLEYLYCYLLLIYQFIVRYLVFFMC